MSHSGWPSDQGEASYLPMLFFVTTPPLLFSSRDLKHLLAFFDLLVFLDLFPGFEFFRRLMDSGVDRNDSELEMQDKRI